MRTALEDEALRIRRYRADDVGALYDAAKASQAEIYRWLPWCPPGYSIDDSRTWVESRPEAWDAGVSYDFVVEDAGSGAFLGGGGLNRIDATNGCANLGYWVRTDAAGRGVATSAARLMMAFGFGDLALNRIEIIAAVDNAASRRVAEKTGAVFEGILHDRLVVGGKAVDAALYALTRPV
ncbi:MAG: GNAT family N-acetyltransferase [Planctomycetes bacterium]|nr:GNAT family N-acetyltransferase [Planctomycetota bacterium]